MREKNNIDKQKNEDSSKTTLADSTTTVYQEIKGQNRNKIKAESTTNKVSHFEESLKNKSETVEFQPLP